MKSAQIRSFFLVRVFPHLDWIWWDTEYLAVFSPNVGKYRPQETPYLVSLRIHSECEKIRTRKTPYLDSFHAVPLIITVRFPCYINLKLLDKHQISQRLCLWNTLLKQSKIYVTAWLSSRKWPFKIVKFVRKTFSGMSLT